MVVGGGSGVTERRGSGVTELLSAGRPWGSDFNFSASQLFLILDYICLSICASHVYVCVHTPSSVCGGQRTTCDSQLSFFYHVGIRD